MTAFHRQLLISILQNLARAVLVLMVIMVAIGLPGFFGGAVSKGASGLSSVLVLLLAIFEFVLPLAMLLATLFTVSSLARHHELTALKAAGWSMHKIMSPVIFVSIAAVVVSATLRVANPSILEPASSSAAEQTAYHARLAYPLANIFAAVVGISLAVSRRRRSKYVGFGVALLVLVAYYVVSATANAMGRHGGLPPVAAGWLATALFTGVAGVLWWRASS